jgi:hypothetical protein
MKIKIVALNIVRMLSNGPNMRDSIWKTNLVMMAEPEGYAETERGKIRVRSKVTCECDTDYHFDPQIFLCLPHFSGQDHASVERFCLPKVDKPEPSK